MTSQTRYTTSHSITLSSSHFSILDLEDSRLSSVLFSSEATVSITPVGEVRPNVRQAVALIVNQEPLTSHKVGVAVDVARAV